jgi:YfiH family protein
MRAPKGVRAFRLNQVHGTDILYVRSDVDIKDTDRIVSARRFDSTACCEFPSDCFGMGDTFAVTNAERDADSVTKAEFLASKSVSKDGQAVVSHACESLQNNSFNDCAADSTLSHTLACGFAGETTVSEVLTRDVAGDYDAVVVDANAYDSAPILCFADCMPLIMVAPTRDFAIAHAGWRGAFGRIAQKAACALACVAQCDTSAINIYIGPYIRTECFEVSPDLRQKFIDEFGEGVASVDSSQPHVDLGMAVRLQLADAGIDPTRICDIDLCTVCNSDTFFSYRASGGVCGRHGAVAFRRYSE